MLHISRNLHQLFPWSSGATATGLIAAMSLHASHLPAQELQFRAQLLKDTVLTHEFIYFEAALKNDSPESVYFRRLAPSREFLGVTMTRLEDNERTEACGLHINDAKVDSSSTPSLAPGGETVQILDLLYRSCLRDSLSGLPYWCPGTYEVEFAYRYDPWGRALFGNSAVLYDTVSLVVREGRSEDAASLDALRDAKVLLRNGKKEEAMERLWSVVRSHPNSPYSDVACTHMLLMNGFGTPLPSAEDRAQMLLAVSSGAAHQPHVRRLVDELARIAPAPIRDSMLESLTRLRPKSFAASRAAEILKRLDSTEE